MQLKVIKADGTQEDYLHTKVLATFVNAFAQPVENNISTAQELAEAVTFYLYGKYNSNKITSSEIFSIIQAALSSTGHDVAAARLTEYHYKRSLLRARLKVIKPDIKKLSDAVKAGQSITIQQENCWNKSKIIDDLIINYNLDRTTARTVASIVEEKILATGFRFVPTDFIRFLALWHTAALISAHQQLNNKETAVSFVNNVFKDEHLRQPQNGFCPVEA
jgi:transcriptional regulator NrdR family protein